MRRARCVCVWGKKNVHSAGYVTATQRRRKLAKEAIRRQKEEGKEGRRQKKKPKKKRLTNLNSSRQTPRQNRSQRTRWCKLLVLPAPRTICLRRRCHCRENHSKHTQQQHFKPVKRTSISPNDPEMSWGRGGNVDWTSCRRWFGGGRKFRKKRESSLGTARSLCCVIARSLGRFAFQFLYYLRRSRWLHFDRWCRDRSRPGLSASEVWARLLPYDGDSEHILWYIYTPTCTTDPAWFYLIAYFKKSPLL